MQVLKLNNQVCFPLYHAYKMVLKLYEPFLDKYGITFIQYLVLLTLFDEQEMSVQEIANRLHEKSLDINQVIVGLEEDGYVQLHREGDEIMKVLISDFGLGMKDELVFIPRQLVERTGFSVERLLFLQSELTELVGNIS